MIITLAAITLAAANPFPEPADDVDGALTSVGLKPLLAVGGHDEKGSVELPLDLAQGSVHGESLEKSALISVHGECFENKLASSKMRKL